MVDDLMVTVTCVFSRPLNPIKETVDLNRNHVNGSPSDVGDLKIHVPWKLGARRVSGAATSRGPSFSGGRATK